LGHKQGAQRVFSVLFSLLSAATTWDFSLEGNRQHSLARTHRHRLALAISVDFKKLDQKKEGCVGKKLLTL
jgi:hypothetical protein